MCREEEIVGLPLELGGGRWQAVKLACRVRKYRLRRARPWLLVARIANGGIILPKDMGERGKKSADGDRVSSKLS